MFFTSCTTCSSVPLSFSAAEQNSAVLLVSVSPYTHVQFNLMHLFVFPVFFKAVKNNAYNLSQTDSRFSFCFAFADKSTETIILSPWFSVNDSQLTEPCS